MFAHPFTGIVAGPSGAGKSRLLQEIVKHSNELIHPAPSRILWCYSEPQLELETLRTSTPHLETTGSLHTLEEKLKESCKPTLLILDDWMSEISNNKTISDLFYKGSHHRNISIFLLLQNIFHRGSVMQDINLNTHYFILFKNPRDAGQIKILARQMFPQYPKYLVDAYEDATREPYGYLLVDLKPCTPNDRRLKSKILPGQTQWVYVPKGI